MYNVTSMLLMVNVLPTYLPPGHPGAGRINDDAPPSVGEVGGEVINLFEKM